MLKTFNVVEKYEEILPFLETKKNPSSFICELILEKMREEQLEDLHEKILKSSANVIQEELRRGIREEVREEIRIEIRSEFRDLKRELSENIKDLIPEIPSRYEGMTGNGIFFSIKDGQQIKQVVKPPLKEMSDPLNLG